MIIDIAAPVYDGQVSGFKNAWKISTSGQSVYDAYADLDSACVAGPVRCVTVY